MRFFIHLRIEIHIPAFNDPGLLYIIIDHEPQYWFLTTVFLLSGWLRCTEMGTS
jgi:hypothetical protein